MKNDFIETYTVAVEAYIAMEDANLREHIQQLLVVWVSEGMYRVPPTLMLRRLSGGLGCV